MNDQTISEEEIEAAAFQIQCEMGCTITAARICAMRALTAAAKVRPPVDEGWRDISSAPKDGSYLIANAIGEVCSCRSRGGHRVVDNMPGFHDWTYGEAPTHWRPLPPPPLPATAENKS